MEIIDDKKDAFKQIQIKWIENIDVLSQRKREALSLITNKRV